MKRVNFETVNDDVKGTLFGLLGISVEPLEEHGIRGRMPVTPQHLAPHGYLHAGAVVSLADSCCGVGCMAALPDGAQSFTTVELKSNHLGTARDGEVLCDATPVHLGRATQVWDAKVYAAARPEKAIALFRCTQMILWPR